MNFIQIMGHLGGDAETRFTPNGQKVTSFSVATSYRKGGKEEVTVWYRVTVWGDRFDKMLPYLKKGSGIIVMGELKPEIFINRDGKPQLSLDVTAETIRFSPFGKGEKSQENKQQESMQGQYGAPAAPVGAYSSGHGQSAPDLDDGLPF